MQNRYEIHGSSVFVTLPDWCRDDSDRRSDDSGFTQIVRVDLADLHKMDKATDKFWRYAAPCSFPPGVYLPQSRDVHMPVGLAHLLLDAPLRTWRAYRDGDPLNCHRSNLLLLRHPPLQRDWLWSTPLPEGFTEVRRSENYIMVRAGKGTDCRLMWQYLLERWQFIRARDLKLTIPRIHEQRTSSARRISAIIQTGEQCTSLDIGDEGPRENCRYAVAETMRVAA